MPAAAVSRPVDQLAVEALTKLEVQFAHDRWLRGIRHRDGAWCLVGGVDAATAAMPPEARSRAIRALVDGLPWSMRWLGRLAPRATLMAYNDHVGQARGVLRLLRTALATLTADDPIATEARVLLGEHEAGQVRQVAST